MNRTRFGIGIGLAGTALAVLLVAGSTAAAQTAPQAAPAVGQSWQAGPGPGLTEEQKAKIKELRATQQTELRASREALRAARQKLNEVRRADTFNEDALRAAAGAVATAQTNEVIARARHRSQFLALLTPDQQARVKQRQAAAARTARVRARQGAQLRAWQAGHRAGMMRGMRRPGMMMGPGGMGRGMGRGMWRDEMMVPDRPASPAPPAPPAKPVKKIEE
jgi:Spy/CpxP family protein refolding chaperone